MQMLTGDAFEPIRNAEKILNEFKESVSDGVFFSNLE